ncbi:MAG: citrate transporter [Ruminococcaceae bacterium]|nr:citrate transporter [Oscillospiraceae bacterium]
METSKYIEHKHHNIKKGLISFAKKNAVLIIAVLAAMITSFIVPPDKEYLGYFDFKTLSCLFSVLAVVCALRNIRFFTILARKIVRLCKNARLCVLTLIYITFLGSMLIANDMALITFLPLGFFALDSTGKQKYLPFTFVMQNISANLGGMITPFGNPQNLYLYSKFGIPTGEFTLIMLFPFVVSVAMITVFCIVFVKKEPLMIIPKVEKLNVKKAVFYAVLFVLSILAVFNIVPYFIVMWIIIVSLIIVDHKALAKVDYGLLFTFCAFFVFAGNMSRIQIVNDVLSFLLSKNTLIFSAFSCQFISNVPSAILLSNFTDNYAHLLLGVNIGGVGTLISSLASLITFREYTSLYPQNTLRYLMKFSIFNFIFLFGLLFLQSIFNIIVA